MTHIACLLQLLEENKKVIIIYVLVTTILAHALADFVFQPNSLMEQKRNIADWRACLFAHIKHALIQAILLFLFLHIFNLSVASKYILSVIAIHAIIDFAKIKFENTSNDMQSCVKYTKRLVLFTIDQLLHIASIIIVWNHFSFHINSTVLNWYKNVFGVINESTIGLSIAAGAVVYVYVCFGGAHFIRLFLDFIYRHVPDYQSKLNSTGGESGQGALSTLSIGKTIGIIERFLILTLFINGEYVSIAAIIGLKSLARFKNLDNKSFAEYYIVGTLTSLSVAAVGVLILSKWV